MRVLRDPVGMALSKAVELLWRREMVIASNIANVDTPGYRAKEFRFEGELRRALLSGRVGEAKGEVVRRPTPPKPDGNTVFLEVEIPELLRAHLKFKACLYICAQRARMVRAAMGRR
ncbi:MAG TPA: hypothetical protein EYP65_05165 [Armatimonadetes bacterium]|nr:hypothetical protein [Armatimonadota bacterium]